MTNCAPSAALPSARLLGYYTVTYRAVTVQTLLF